MTTGEGSDPSRVLRDKDRDRRLLGTVIAGKYKTLEVLGQGGFGTVFLVEILTGMVGERLALKILPREFSRDERLREQFLNEIRVAMKMVDKHIVQIRDVGVAEHDGGVDGDGTLLYYTMDYVAGRSLAQILREEGRLDVPRTLRLVRRVLAGLVTAHSAGIIHRDLKPANIMVQTGEDGKERPRILDFGIAMVVRAQSVAKPDSSRSSRLAGSMHYMPPEQFQRKELGFYTDVYSAGVIIYECLTGRKPFPGSTPREVYESLKKGPAKRVGDLAVEVEAYPGLEQAVMKAIERHPSKRFPTAKALFEELNAVVERKAAAARQKRRPRPHPEIAEHPAFEPAFQVDELEVWRPAERPAAERRVRKPLGPIVPRGLLGPVVVIGGALVLGFLFKDRIEAFFRPRSAKTLEPATDVRAEPPESSEPRRRVVIDLGPETPLEPEPPDPRREFDKHLGSARRAIEEADWSQAIASATLILNHDPAHAGALLPRGIAHLRQSNYAAAMVDLEGAARNASLRLTALRHLGEAHLRSGSFRNARRCFEEVEAAEGRDLELSRWLLDACEGIPDHESFCRILLDLQKEAVADEELGARCKRYLEDEPRERREQCELLAEEALAEYEAREFARSVEKALDAYAVERARCAESDPLRPERAASLAQALYESQLRVEDLDSLQRTIGILEKRALQTEGAADPGWPVKMRMLEAKAAFLVYDLGQRFAASDAERHLTAILEDRQAPRDVRCWAQTARGVLYAKQSGDLDQVKGEFDRVPCRTDPHLLYLQARAFIGLAESGSVQDARKEECYQFAKNRLSDYVKSRKLSAREKAAGNLDLGYCYLRLGPYQNKPYGYLLQYALGSLKDAERDAAALGRRERELYERLATVYEQLAFHATPNHYYTAAGTYYAKAYDVEPHVDWCAKAVQAYTRSGNLKSARDLIEKAFKDFPADKTLQALWQQVERSN